MTFTFHFRLRFYKPFRLQVKSASVRAGLTKRRRSERKVTRMVVIIVFVFVLCWLPFFTANIVNLFYVIPENETTAAIYFTLVILTYVNSCANPFLYGFLSENFEKNMKKALQCGKQNNPASPKSGRQSTAKVNQDFSVVTHKSDKHGSKENSLNCFDKKVKVCEIKKKKNLSKSDEVAGKAF